MNKENKLSKSSIDFFEQYSQKASDVTMLKEHIRDLQKRQQEEVDALYAQVQSLEKDCIGMRRIITRVLEDGIDAVEARLIDDTPNATTIWQNYHQIGGQLDIVRSSHLYPDNLSVKLTGYGSTAPISPNAIPTVIGAGLGVYPQHSFYPPSNTNKTTP